METKETNCHPKPLVNATCLLGEKGCYKDGKCHYIGNCEHKVLTNADRIRAMSDKEIAEFLSAKCADIQAQQLSTSTATQLSALAHTWYCAWMQWLKQPVEE